MIPDFAFTRFRLAKWEFLKMVEPLLVGISREVKKNALFWETDSYLEKRLAPMRYKCSVGASCRV